MKLKRAPSPPSFPELAKAVLARWQREGTFQESLKRSHGKPEYIFYDGPPFPTGSPHHGTVFVSILKDIVPRYKTMRGYYVPRAWGWDCHGLPIETQAEKNLGIKEKSEIEGRLGVAAFNAECARIVSSFNDAWKVYIDRIGRWVDFDTPYRTLDRNFMESVIWAFSEIYKKQLIYKDFRVSPYCYRCETPLSISDTRLDDATRPTQDRAITVKFPIHGKPGWSYLAWTTTPWTLPSNLALGVGAALAYVAVEHKGEVLVLGEAACARYEREIGKDAVIQARYTGLELAQSMGRYDPPFSYFVGREAGAHRVILADFVSTDDGTGIVHLAPAFGDDDYWACKKNGIGVVTPVDAKGCFTEEVPDFAGRNVHEANADVIKLLKGRGLVIRDETFEHNYPHCWRCRTPLIYRALDAWYLKVEAIKADLIKNNQQISWYPDGVKEGRFGKWLENARDWNISRNRYWATPIPVWFCTQCGKNECAGSVQQIEGWAGKAMPNLHKEFLDQVQFACACGGTMKRTPEVLDCWFESASMPYGQYHYPFENAEHFRSHFPADFIVEYTGQIRGWFYVMHVLSTALFGTPAFKHCMVHGTLLAADGKKISKSLKNYTDPLLLIDRFGPDALRAYLVSSVALQMEDLNFKDEGVQEVVRKLNLPLWNALVFITTYAEIDGVGVEDLSIAAVEQHLTELDRYILAELELLIARSTEQLDRYELNVACRALPEFLDILNNWFIRRSRPRVWGADPKAPDKMAFYATLYRVLSRFCTILAPFCPFLAESVWEQLGYTESVHLAPWPECERRWIDERLLTETAHVREIVRAGLAIRARERVRVRQPLAEARVVLDGRIFPAATGLPDAYQEILREELNVKTIRLVADPGEIATRVGKANAKLLGPKYGARVQDIVRRVKAGDFSIGADGRATVGDVVLEAGDIEVSFVGKDGLAVESSAGAVVALDIRITEALLLEGQARDIVRQIQDLRKEAGLDIADRIDLALAGPVEQILAQHKDYILQETLAVSLAPELAAPQISGQVALDDQAVAQIALQRAVR